MSNAATKTILISHRKFHKLMTKTGLFQRFAAGEVMEFAMADGGSP